MHFSKTLFTTLQLLISGQSVAASSLRKDIASELIDEGLLTIHANGSRRTYRAIQPSSLRNFLLSRFEEFRVLEDIPEVLDNGAASRAQLAKSTGNSKIVPVRSCRGFPVNSYEPIECVVANNALTINPPEGSFIFIADWSSFTIPRDVIVIGIENMENFIEIIRQRAFFDDYIENHLKCDCSPRLLFVSRYPQSDDLRSWLQSIPNQYIHFGDFDLAGIDIFLNQFHKYLGERASFLIPEDIEQRLKTGTTERYNLHYSKYKSLVSDIPHVRHLISLIHTYRRGYDQEGYIDCEK